MNDPYLQYFMKQAGLTEDQVNGIAPLLEKDQAPQEQKAPVKSDFVDGTPEELKPIIQKASDTHGIPTSILSAQLKQESGFNPKAVSPVGAQGIAQFMPDTAKEFGIDPLDPAQAIDAQAKYLKQNLDKFGSMDKALAAYNAGPGNVEQAGGVPNIPETQQYVQNILTTSKTTPPATVGESRGDAPTPEPPTKPVDTTFPVTQTFGEQSPYDMFSGGVNTGVDIATPPSTPVNFAGNDQWQVEDLYDMAQGGGLGNPENQGYGNSILVKNMRTGERLRISHLQDVNPTLSKGALITDPTKVARTGATGNVTGPHADIEYYDPSGQKGNVLKTPYANIFGNKDLFSGMFAK